MLGFGALGEFALGEAAEIPPQPRWAAPSFPAGGDEIIIVQPPPIVVTD